MMVDDDEAFLYGDEDEPSVPTPLNGDAPEAAMSDGEPDEGDDSESDLEIILDGEGVAPIRKPLPVVAPKPAAPVEPATAPAPAATTEYVPQERPAVIGPAPASLAQVQTVQFPPSQSTKIESKPFEEPLASTSSSAGFLAPPEPPAAPAPAVSTVPSLDVDFAPKDVNGNDLFDTDIDALEDKAWRRPGANQADWFNYGMNEQAWKNYVAKQKRLRQTENLDNNPFAAFATGSVADAWQSLGPEMKAVMMATIMGYQPGNPGMMQGMMGGGQGFQGMPQMGYGMDMGAFNGGMGGEQMGYGNQIQQGFEGNGEAPEGGDGGEHDGAYGHGSARGGRGGGFANRGGRGGGRGGGEARAPLPPRHQPALPSNVPTGPRNRGAAPVAPRKERAYLDKDRGGQSASEGLDYGGGDSTHDKSPVNSRRSRDDEGRSSGNRRRSRDRSAESDDRARGSSSRANGGSSRRSGRGERSESKSVDIGSLTGLERIAAEEQARKIKKEAGEDDRDRGSRSPVRIRGAAGSEHGDGNDIVENDDDRRRRADDESDRRSRRRDEEDDRSGSRRKDHRSSRRSYDDEDDSSSRRHRDDSYDDSRKRKATEEVDERSRRKTSSRKDAMRYDDE